MRFEPLTKDRADTIVGWFDDPQTIRYLGQRDWLYRELDLVLKMPGSEFRGRRVMARHVWVVYDDKDRPCALVDIEPYNDGTASMVLVVAPDQRNHHIGVQVLHAISGLAEMRSVHAIVGSIEPDNMPARRCCERAGYQVAIDLDEEGMLAIEKIIRPETTG